MAFPVKATRRLRRAAKSGDYPILAISLNDLAVVSAEAGRLRGRSRPKVGTGLGGPSLAALTDRGFPAAGQCGIPVGAIPISVDIAATGSTKAGNIRFHALGGVVPLISSISYGEGQMRSNNAVISLSAEGTFGAYLDQAVGMAHLILDVNGYFK